MKPYRLTIAAILVLGLLSLVLFKTMKPTDSAALLEAGIVALPESRPVPDLTLQNQDGQAFSSAELRGKWSLLFFGYTFCPDICPTTLAQLRDLRSKLPPEAVDRLQVVFISVDPQRDSPARIKEYLGFFKADFKGITGSLENLQKLSNALNIPFIPADTRTPNYTVDHSGNLAIIAPDGRQYGFIRAPLRLDKLRTELPKVLAGQP